MTHNGTFDPPAMGQRHVPISISGEGTVVQSERGLSFEGYKAGGLSSTFLAGIVLLLLLGSPVLIVGLGLEISGKTFGYLVMAPVIGVIMTRRKTVSTTPMSFEVPWANIKSVEVGREGFCLEILVKGQSPKGMVYFKPRGDVQAVCKQLQAAIEG